MVLQQLQDLLAGIYDLPMQYSVYDFLFTERERLPQTVRDSSTDEQVLVLDRGRRGARWACFWIHGCSSACAAPIRSRRCTPAIWPTTGPRSRA